MWAPDPRDRSHQSERSKSDEAMRDRITARFGQAYASELQERGGSEEHRGNGGPRINDLTEAGPGA